VIKDIRAQAKRTGQNKITMEEINVEIEAASREKQRKSNDRRAS
jgi:hypothetical protein